MTINNGTEDRCRARDGADEGPRRRRRRRGGRRSGDVRALRRRSSGPGGHVANVGVHGHSATLHLETLWIRDVTITTGLVDTVTTPQLLRLIEGGGSTRRRSRPTGSPRRDGGRLRRVRGRGRDECAQGRVDGRARAAAARAQRSAGTSAGRRRLTGVDEAAEGRSPPPLRVVSELQVGLDADDAGYLGDQPRQQLGSTVSRQLSADETSPSRTLSSSAFSSSHNLRPMISSVDLTSDLVVTADEGPHEVGARHDPRQYPVLKHGQPAHAGLEHQSRSGWDRRVRLDRDGRRSHCLAGRRGPRASAGLRPPSGRSTTSASGCVRLPLLLEQEIALGEHSTTLPSSTTGTPEMPRWTRTDAASLSDAERGTVITSRVITSLTFIVHLLGDTTPSPNARCVRVDNGIRTVRRDACGELRAAKRRTSSRQTPRPGS